MAIKTSPGLRILFFVLFIFASAPCLAKSQTAESFLNSIYDQYRGDPKTANGIYLDSDLAIKRYFTPSTAALIINNDEDAKKRNEVPYLDGDPFVDGQEWKIDSFDIDVRHIGRSAADATVRFKNLDQQKEINISLKRIHKQWRINDIFWDNKGGSLRGLYEKKE